MFRKIHKKLKVNQKIFFPVKFVTLNINLSFKKTSLTCAITKLKRVKPSHSGTERLNYINLRKFTFYLGDNITKFPFKKSKNTEKNCHY